MQMRFAKSDPRNPPAPLAADAQFAYVWHKDHRLVQFRAYGENGANFTDTIRRGWGVYVIPADIDIGAHTWERDGDAIVATARPHEGDKAIPAHIVCAPYWESAAGLHWGESPKPPPEELARLKAKSFALIEEYGIEPDRWYVARLPVGKDGKPWYADGDPPHTWWYATRLDIRISTGEGDDAEYPKGERVYYWDFVSHCDEAGTDGDNPRRSNSRGCYFRDRSRAEAVVSAMNAEAADKAAEEKAWADWRASQGD